jgi:cytosine/adenosine deaminase-related metal-dependent hydrolase
VRKLSADYVFPVSQPPVKKGIIIVDDHGKITENIIDPSLTDYSLQDVEYYPGFICPGFINSHCHLELSYLRGKMTENSGLDKFIVELEQIRKGIKEEEQTEAIHDAEQEMIKNGIVAAADICNSNSTFSIKNNSKIYYHSFIESFASDPQRSELAFDKALKLYNEIIIHKNNNVASITPHAPYSLSKDLFSKIKEFALKTGNIISIHHQESEEENKFFLSSNGNIKDMHHRFGVEKSDFSNSGLRPLAAIADFLPKNNPVQLVHNTVTTDIDIDFAEQNFKELYWCFCPNANLFIEQKLPEFALFYNKKCRITVGTDSLASNRSLSVLDELKTIWASIPFIPLNEMLKWATINGAEFIKQGNRLGTIEKGKTPGLLLLENMNNTKIHFTREAFVRVLI